MAARGTAADDDPMTTTYTDVTPGKRFDIAVQFITKRPIQSEGGRVHRLLVADEAGTRFTILATPDSDPLLNLKTGGTYLLSGLLGADAVDSASTGEECPHCGDALRQGSILDTAGREVVEAAASLGVEDTVGVFDAETSCHRISRDETLVDDWTPMGSDDTVTPPAYVCPSCEKVVAEYELAQPTTEHHFQGDELANEAPAAMHADMASPETVGLAAGGAKDVGNFRENVANGYTPQPEAISDEGLFYDYYFETGAGSETDALFAPRYAAAVSEHPISGESEQYLSVGLDSTLSVEEFERPRLDLVAVLDVSGSMSSPFDAYYYDEHGTKHDAEDDASTKLAAATQSLCALTEQLHENDRLGVVLYNHRAHVAKPLRDVGSTDMRAIRRHIQEIAAGGSTNLADGFEAAMDMLLEAPSDPSREQRVVFMTDMMPNTGATGDEELTTLFTDAAARGVHTTFVGMGLDANAELAETLSGIRGANHYFIHSAAEFERRLGEEFAYMVTPLVYDLSLELDAEGYEIEAVYGSPDANPATGRLMHVGTLFPSAKEDGEARGGVVLVRVAETAADVDLELVASWTERDGGEYTERVRVDVPTEPGTYAHSGIRKAIALARYADELRAWAGNLQDRADGATGVDDWILPNQRGQHERESVPLAVPERYTRRFEQLRTYLAAEMDAVDDSTLEQEIDLLDTLAQEAPEVASEVRD